MDDRHLYRTGNLRILRHHVLPTIGVLVNWLLDHSQVLTAAAVFAVPLAFALFIGYLYRNTPEQPKPQINPEDYPPFSAWANTSAAITHIEIAESTSGEFPAGAYIHVSPDGNHAVLATEETHNAIADGKGGYIK